MTTLASEIQDKIDKMSERDLILELKKGQDSNFKGPAFEYLINKLEAIEREQLSVNKRAELALQQEALAIAKEANRLNRKAIGQIWLPILAIIISLFALWQSYEANSPDLKLTQLRPLVWEQVSDEKRSYYAVLQFDLSNAGGRAVSLKAIRKREDLGVVSAVYENGEQRSISNSFNFYTFELETHERYTAMTSFDEIKKYIPLNNEAVHIAKKIEPGESTAFYLGISSYAIDKDIQELIVEFEMRFSDDTVIPVVAIVEPRPKRRRR